MDDRLHIWYPRASDRCRDLLSRSIPSGIRIEFGNDEDDTRIRKDLHVLVEGQLTESLLDRCPDLTTVVVPWAGLPESARPLLRKRPHLSVHNIHHNDAATAETALALLLSTAKRIVPLDRAMRRNDWSPRFESATIDQVALLDGSHALVLGYGAIGRRVASACAALGMRVTALRRSSVDEGKTTGIRVETIERLDELLPIIDVLIVTLPLTDATHGLLDARRLGLLRAHVIVINVGRGAIIDEQALYESLRDGRLAGAGLDVWWNYPVDAASRCATAPSGLPFRGLDNVVMSPHRGGDTNRTDERRAKALLDIFEALARGACAPNRVDLDKGY